MTTSVEKATHQIVDFGAGPEDQTLGYPVEGSEAECARYAEELNANYPNLRTNGKDRFCVQAIPDTDDDNAAPVPGEAERVRPDNCECDNTHEQNKTVCMPCWNAGFRYETAWWRTPSEQEVTPERGMTPEKWKQVRDELAIEFGVETALVPKKLVVRTDSQLPPMIYRGPRLIALMQCANGEDVALEIVRAFNSHAELKERVRELELTLKETVNTLEVLLTCDHCAECEYCNSHRIIRAELDILRSRCSQ